MSRHRHASFLAAAVAAVLVAGLALASGAGAFCAPVLGACPPGTTAEISAPAVAAAAPTDVTSTTATVHAVVDPDGLPTSYDFNYALPGGAVESTAPVELAADQAPQPVSAQLTGLTPDATYTVAIVAENGAGEKAALGALHTAVEPVALTITGANANPITVRAGTPVTISARVAGQLALYTREFGAPRAHLLSAPSLSALSLAGLADTTPSASGVVRFLPVVPDRNTRFRVRIGSLRSRWIAVFVAPVVQLYSARVTGQPGLVRLAYSAGGGVRPELRGPVAFFYRARAPHGPFQRIGAARMHRSGYLLQATFTAAAPPGAFFIACTRRRIIPTMGRAFRDRRCGRARLR